MFLHILPTSPRVLILEQDHKLLLISAVPPDSSSTGSSTPYVLMDLRETSDYPRLLMAVKGAEEVETYELLGCAGLLDAEGYTYLVGIAAAESVGPCRTLFQGYGAEPVWNATRFSYFCLEDYTPPSYSHDVSATSSSHPCYGVNKILSNRHFYFSGSADLDITTRVAERMKKDAEILKDPRKNTKKYWSSMAPGESRSGAASDSTLECDCRFLFNTTLLGPFLSFRESLASVPQAQEEFDDCGFMTPLIEGYHGVEESTIGETDCLIAVTSRLGWKFAGTRFNRRGIDMRDPEGSVGNFAETEVVIRTKDTVVSFVQVRGSVPLHWTEEPSFNHGPKVFIHDMDSPSGLDVTLDHFRDHFYSLFDHYHQIHIVSCLFDDHSSTRSIKAEIPLSDTYARVANTARTSEREFKDNLAFSEFDLQTVTQFEKHMEIVPTALRERFLDTIDDFGATVAKVGRDGRVARMVAEQTGAFRVNCRDCLDRTNVVETNLSEIALDEQLARLGLPPLEGTLAEKDHRVLWSENGDALSLIYCGTGAMNALFTKTGVATTKDKVLNGEKYAERIRQLKRDPAKQFATDQVVGRVGSGSEMVKCIPADEARREGEDVDSYF